ncbi:MAG: hypothetical protein H7282_16205 [Cytophagaceae bacterium]|nr:hypothetical protein [Cytophagaceae bacterium]
MEKETSTGIDTLSYEGSTRVEVFKTNVVHEQDADHLLGILSQNFPWFDVHFDLEDCDRILRIEGNGVFNEQIISLLSRYGYECTALV